MTQRTYALLVTALTTFIVTAGTAVLAAIGNGQAPSTWALVAAGLGGLVQAAMTVQKHLEAPPQ